MFGVTLGNYFPTTFVIKTSQKRDNDVLETHRKYNLNG